MSRQAVLFTPGDERRMVEKALTSDADMVILDIEDSVAPTAKDAACETVADVLADEPSVDVTVEVSVRINPLSTRGERDLSLLLPAKEAIENIVLPKVLGEAEVNELTGLLFDHQFYASIIPVIEHPESVVNLPEIAYHPFVDALEFGAEDFTTEIGAIHTDHRTEILYARQKVSAVAAAAGIDALDMAWPDFTDTEGLRKNAQTAVEFGYDGKSAIHPVQVEVIHDVFTPDPEQIEWAKRVVEGAEEAEAQGKVVFQLDGEMIDPPIINRARDILERTGPAE